MNRQMQQTDLLSDIAMLADGSSTKVVCPSCHGGSSRERSLRLARRAGVVYARCYRASCGWAGVHSGVWHASTSTEQAVRTYRGDTRALTGDERASMYGLADDEILDAGCAIDIATGRMVFEIRDRYGAHIGHTLRSMKPTMKPKTITYGTATYHCPVPLAASHRVILVEDVISSIKCARFMPSMALLGTRLTDTHIAMLKDAGIKRVYLCLDSDAIPLAYKYKRLYEIFFQEIVVIEVDKDPKDMENPQLESLLRGAK